MPTRKRREKVGKGHRFQILNVRSPKTGHSSHHRSRQQLGVGTWDRGTSLDQL